MGWRYIFMCRVYVASMRVMARLFYFIRLQAVGKFGIFKAESIRRGRERMEQEQLDRITHLLDGLNDQQAAFVIHYLKTGKMKESAIAAGYSEKAASQRAYKLMKNPKILEAIRAIRQELVADIREKFVQDAYQARKLLLEIMNDPEAPAGLRASIARDFLNRAGFKPAERQEIEHTAKGEVKVVFNIPRPPKEKGE
jgi:Terminase small subunit